MSRLVRLVTVVFVALGALAPLATRASVPVQDATPPVWATPDRFWFSVPVAGGRTWWIVDARTGVRDRLFDHGRLAIEINAQSGADFTALTLPFADPATGFAVKFDGRNNALDDGLALEFTLDDERWRCELNGEWDWGKKSDYYCEKPDDGTAPAPAQTRPVVSPDGRWEASVQNNNVAVRQTDGRTQLLSKDGTDTAPYHLGSLRWSADSRTLAGYRVNVDAWRSAQSAGSVKTLVQRQEWKMGPGVIF